MPFLSRSIMILDQEPGACARPGKTDCTEKIVC